MQSHLSLKNNEITDLIEKKNSLEEKERSLNIQLKNSKEDIALLKGEIDLLNQK